MKTKKSVGFMIRSIGLLLTAIFLVGCQTYYYYDYEEMKETVEKIEIIEVTDIWEEQGEWKVLKILNDDEMDELLVELSKIRFTYPFGAPIEVYGLCLKIYYINQDYKYEILSRLRTRFFDENDKRAGSYSRRCSKEDFETLFQNLEILLSK